MALQGCFCKLALMSWCFVQGDPGNLDGWMDYQHSLISHILFLNKSHHTETAEKVSHLLAFPPIPDMHFQLSVSHSVFNAETSASMYDLVL